MRKYFLILTILLLQANAIYSSELPWVKHVSTVAPHIIEIIIQEGRVQQHHQSLYEAEDGDSIDIQYHHNILSKRHLYRNGELIGFIAGRDQKVLTHIERVMGDTLDLSFIADVHNYKITSDTDVNYSVSRNPVVIYRKTKVNNWAEPNRQMALEHHLYLSIPHPLVKGSSYRIDLGALNVQKPGQSFIYDHETVRSEAVHVNQAGFRIDDPGKRAYLSTWLGDGGGLDYKEGTPFYLLNHSGEAVYQGKIALGFSDDKIDIIRGGRNYTLAPVYYLEFGDLKIPGTYRVVVSGVGCSYAFEIGRESWQSAFKTVMKGFYHSRSGIELGPPYTDYKRPRSYSDAEVTVYQSTTPIMNSGNGLNALGTDKGNFANLIAGCTDQTVTNSYGGYHDAGDWDRRIQHLVCTRLHLELLTLFPEYFSNLDLNLPESNNKLPDVLDEALFNLDHYRRLQTEEGGIRGGVEAEAHPVDGETSWQESLKIMTYAPGIWSSYYYASVAARAAYVLKNRAPELSSIYKESARSAIEWAEERIQAWLEDEETRHPRDVTDQRSLAALEMYRLTSDRKWHELFLENTDLKNPENVPVGWVINPQIDAAFLYTQLSSDLIDDTLMKTAKNMILAKADSAIYYQENNAFNHTSTWIRRPPMVGFFSTPDALVLARAHFLTGQQRYLAALVRSMAYTAGANPHNTAYTVGIGRNSIKNPMHIDSRLSGQKAPEGITIYGQFDLLAQKDKSQGFTWPLTWFLGHKTYPDVYEWPVNEALFECYKWPIVLEWTPFQTLGPLSYLYGYLAGRS